MVEIIAGEKGTGKTKALITKANDSALVTNGSIVFLDKNNKHMYELSNRIRMINVPAFHIDNFDMFCGFLYGIVSQNHNIDKIFLDNFLTISHMGNDNLENALDFLLDFSESQELDIIVSLSMDAGMLPERMKSFVSVSL